MRCKFAVSVGVSVIGLLLAVPAHGQTVRTEITGVSGEMRDNVAVSLGLKRAEQFDQVSIWRLRQLALDAREEAQTALQPFGYYSAAVNVRLTEPEADGAPWRARVEITLGEPVRVTEPSIRISPPAADLEAFKLWREDWPLAEGAVLRHAPWTQKLDQLQRLAETHGFYEGRFAERTIRVFPNRNEAELHLNYESGPRYRIGSIDYGDPGFNDDLMRALTVVDPGDPYLSSDIDELRQTLVRSGYFDQVVIDQQRNAESDEVELRYALERKPPNTYRVLAGFGTDTGLRGQIAWTRHYLSSRGDRMEVALGAQETDSEFVLRGLYEHPYGGEPGNFLFTEVLLKRENDRFRFEDEDRVEPVFEPFGGDRNQAQLFFGRKRQRPLLDAPFLPLNERLFVTFLNERFDAFSRGSLSAEQEALLANNPGLRRFLDTDTNTVAVGGEWTLTRLEGDGFNTEGLYAQTRLLGSLEALGSDTSFLQGYAQARWHWLFLPRHKLLFRGEIGYTEADTEKLLLTIPDDPRALDLDITELPELFRFKTGGDRTVRGFSYEALSTNRNGANHIMVGSIEYEYNFYGDFSIAGFYDVGNAFNDFAAPELKRSFGGGLRWYTLVGPVQLDLAHAIDDDSLRIHFTIGTKLL